MKDMKKRRLTQLECEKLYKKYNTPTHVIGHCKAVTLVAMTIGKELNEKGYNLDIELIQGAGLAHDVARTQEKHWDIGAKILADLGYKDEAAIVKVHMFYEFNDFNHLNETDMVCLGDRLVKEDKYVGLDERIQYIINKAGNIPERTSLILDKKAETEKLITHIEKVIGKKIDSLF